MLDVLTYFKVLAWTRLPVHASLALLSEAAHLCIVAGVKVICVGTNSATENFCLVGRNHLGLRLSCAACSKSGVSGCQHVNQ